MQASVPLPLEGTAGHAAGSVQHSSSSVSAHHQAEISRLIAEVRQLNADKQALLAKLTSAEQGEKAEDGEEEGGGKLAKLDTEVAQLKTDRQLLISRVGAVEQMLAEARRAVDQKEGHLQGLQVGAVTCPSLPLLQAGVWFFSSYHQKHGLVNMALTAVLTTDHVNCKQTCTSLYNVASLRPLADSCLT